MKVKVYVTLKPGVLDPQGEAIKGGLHGLGFNQVKGVRLGKFFEIDLQDGSEADVDELIKEMSNKLLANTVIENFSFEVVHQ